MTGYVWSKKDACGVIEDHYLHRKRWHQLSFARRHQPSPLLLLNFTAVDMVEVLHYHHLLHCHFPHLVRHWHDMCEKPQDGDVPECSCTCEAKSLVVPERLFTRNYVCVKEAKDLCV